MNSDTKIIKANLDYLRKLFIMPDSPDKFIEFGHELLEMIHDFFKEKGGIHSSISLPELSRIFNRTAIPEEPHLIKDVLSEIKEKVIAHSVKVANPYYIGHMTSAIPYFMILLEMIIAALNQNQVKIETAKASSFVERELMAWFHRLIFNRSDVFYERNVQNPRVALGNATADGTISNLTAFIVAREKAFPPDGEFPGVRVAGMERGLHHYGYSRGVILVSSRGHYSIQKAANLLGLGEDNVLAIPADGNHRIDIRRLAQKVKSLKRRRGPKLLPSRESPEPRKQGASTPSMRWRIWRLKRIPIFTWTRAGVVPPCSWMNTGLCSRESKRRTPFPSTPTNCFTAPWRWAWFSSRMKEI